MPMLPQYEPLGNDPDGTTDVAHTTTERVPAMEPKDVMPADMGDVEGIIFGEEDTDE